MTDAFTAFLLVLAVQHYLGLGNWIWWVLGATLIIDVIIAIVNSANSK